MPGLRLKIAFVKAVSTKNAVATRSVTRSSRDCTRSRRCQENEIWTDYRICGEISEEF